MISNNIEGAFFRIRNAILFCTIHYEIFILCNGKLIKLNDDARLILAAELIFEGAILLRTNRISAVSEKLLMP
jgi:hypothetical protein